MPYIPLHGDELFNSTTWITSSHEARSAALRLWWHSFAHEVPAASLPADDSLLAEHAGYGVAIKAWQKVKAAALRGWIKCSDGRFYHPFVANLANAAWEERLAQRARTEAARSAREANRRIKTPVTDNVTKTVTENGKPHEPTVTESKGSKVKGSKEESPQPPRGARRKFENSRSEKSKIAAENARKELEKATVKS